MYRAVIAAVVVVCGCGGSGKDWVRDLPDPHAPVPDPGWNTQPDPPADPVAAAERPREQERADEPPPAQRGGSAEPATALTMSTPPAPAGPDRLSYAPDGSSLATDLYRNTYYDFPKEGPGKKDATVFDASCAPIAPVTKTFHDQVCVQGSGQISGGATISFAKRGCPCAATCPRTGQQICFERLDPAKFPAGRGAMGKAITPLRSVAVDPTVIPLGTVIYIPELAGLPRPDGSRHDGCFIAEDRGLRVQGRQVDVFTGDPSVTARWNKLFPSNKGVHVRVNDPRCRGFVGGEKKPEG